MECKADVRERGWEVRLEFSLDLAVCLYPAGSGEPLKSNSSSASKLPFTMYKMPSTSRVSLWSDVDLELHEGTMPVGLF